MKLRHRKKRIRKRRLATRQDRILTLANAISISRVLLALPLVWTLENGNLYQSLGIIILIVLSDWLDGYVARKADEITNFGNLIDPIADKIIVATALILLVMDGTIKNYEVIAAIIILTREILISGLREFLAKGKINLPVSSLAKAKTFLQMIAISVLLTGETGNKIVNFQDYNAQTIGIILLWLSAFLTLYTGYEYLRKGIDHAISEDEKN